MAIFQQSSEAIEVLKKPVNSKEISKAKRKRLRTEVHTETINDVSEFHEGHRELMRWIENDVLKDSEVFKRMKGVIRAPFPSNELTQSIYNQVPKIFKAEDRYIDFEFTDEELKIDAELYRKRIGDHTFWPTEGFQTYKSCIDNLLVVDLPRLDEDDAGNFISNTERPEPFYFILDINRLWSIEFSKVTIKQDEFEGLEVMYKVEHIAYTQNKGEEYVVIDDLFYRVYKKTGSEYTLISESRHDLNYVPAQSFWQIPLNKNTALRKANQITKSESELDWFDFYTWAAKYLKLYAPFPIYAGYKPTCTYRDKTHNTVCNNGYHYWTDTQGNKMNKKCPKCEGRGKPGPGAYLQVKAPQDPKEDPDLLKNPIVVIPAEKVSVEVVNQELQDTETKIWRNCVGRGDEILEKEDVNEDQVEAVTDNKRVILFGIKKGFEIIHKFAIDTVFRLRYGDSYLGSTINYGEDYLPESELTVIKAYSVAKDAGLPSYDLASRRRLLNHVKYRNNPKMLERVKVLEHLEPFPGLGLTELSELRNSNPGIVSAEDFLLKANFPSFIARFERENADVLTHGSALSFDIKINNIREIILNYVRDELERAGETQGG